MAVYKRTYKSFSGEKTSSASRFLVVTRYSFGELLQLRAFMVSLVISAIPFLVALAFIYVMNSSAARLALNMGNMPPLPIDNKFFAKLLAIQDFFAIVLTAYSAPVITSPDLTNNALSLFLSRPFSRAEYVLGKSVVLAAVISAVTWIPDLLLFGVQSTMAGWHWMSDNWFIAPGIVLGAFLYIAMLCLMSLAVSAWVKWRVVATGFVFGLFFVPAGFGVALNAILRTGWGHLLNPSYLMQVVWNDLLRVPPLFNLPSRNGGSVPVGAAWAMIVFITFACLMMLNKRLRAKEVVRG